VIQPQRYFLLGTTDRARVLDFVERRVGAWCDEWLARGAQRPAVSWQSAAEEHSWLVAGAGSAHTVALGCSEEWLDDAALLLVGEAAGEARIGASQLTGEIARSALQDLAVALCPAAGAREWRDEVPLDRLQLPGSGYVLMRLDFGAARPPLSVLGWPGWLAHELDAEVAVPARASTALTSPRQALERQVIVLQAVLGVAELTVTELAALCQGDVLLLDRRLEQPLALCAEGGRPVVSGHLCAHDGQRALQIAAPAK
jgi:flagellar motor switch/type III secretory pathway protein FliN